MKNVGYLAGYFASARQTFERSVTSGAESRNHTYAIGDFNVRLCFANDSLSDLLLTAINHNALSVVDSDPDLNVYIWDTQSTRTLLEPPDWNLVQYVERGNRRLYSDERHVLIYDRRTSVFNMIDLQLREAIYWVRDSSWLPYYEIAAPLRYLFQGWLQAQGDFIVHSGAVGLPHGGALIMGPTGSGKSSTSLSCLNSRLQYAGDDYILVRSSPQPTAFSLYNSAKINAHDLERFRPESRYVANPDRLDIEKAMIFLHQGYAGKLIRKFPICVLISASVGDGVESSYVKLDSADFFRRIAPDSVFTMLGNAKLIFQGLRELSQKLPSYHFTLGQDKQALVESIEAVIDKHAR